MAANLLWVDSKCAQDGPTMAPSDSNMAGTSLFNLFRKTPWGYLLTFWDKCVCDPEFCVASSCPTRCWHLKWHELLELLMRQTYKLRFVRAPGPGATKGPLQRSCGARLAWSGGTWGYLLLCWDQCGCEPEFCVASNCHKMGSRRAP